MTQGKSFDASGIFPKGEKGSPEIFTGTVWFQILVNDDEKVYDTQVYNVIFEPGARTHWHSHPGGQILIITGGTGYYQERGKPAQLLKKGDTVTIPPDTLHWHGASPDEEFVHIGMSTRNDKGPAVWHGPVTEEEYSDAVK